MVKKSGFASEMNNPDHISESLETIFRVKIFKFFDADPGTVMEKIRIRDPEKTYRISTTTKTWYFLIPLQIFNTFLCYL
jgi:hypothetical protein